MAPVDDSAEPQVTIKQRENDTVEEYRVNGKLYMTQLAISATQVRNLLLNGRSPRYLLPAQVIAYIEAHGLYRNT